MSSRSKGRRNELAYKKLLESRGYLVYLVKMPTKFSKDQDIFKLFDGIAVKNHYGYKISINHNVPITKINNSTLLFFQIKTNRKPKLEPFRLFKLAFPMKEIKIIIAIHHDHGGWEEIEI